MSSTSPPRPTHFSSLTEAYVWLDSHINFEPRLDRIAYDDRTFTLDSFRSRLTRLGDPHRGIPTIHIAGTRGKGSTALLLEALLMASGKRVATFTSPHLREYRERIRIDGAPAEPSDFMRGLAAAAAESGAGNSEGIKTVFELLTATFFLTAREAKVDFLVVETGLGGRLDCTNVLDPGPVLLTRIGLEHTRLLGDTIEKIAAEKAAILKRGGWGIFSVQADDGAAEKVFADRAREVGAELNAASDVCPLLAQKFHSRGLDLTYEFEGRPLHLELPQYGVFWAENIQSALSVFARLRALGRIGLVPHKKIVSALESVKIEGRMQSLPSEHGESGRLIVDSGHDPTAAQALARSMEAHFGPEPAVAYVSLMADKDATAFFRDLARWPHWEELVVYEADIERAAPARTLASAAEPFFERVITCSNMDSAVQSATGHAEKGHRIVFTGTIYALARIYDWSAPHGRDSKSLPIATQAEPSSGAGNT